MVTIIDITSWVGNAISWAIEKSSGAFSKWIGIAVTAFEAKIIALLILLFFIYLVFSVIEIAKKFIKWIIIILLVLLVISVIISVFA